MRDSLLGSELLKTLNFFAVILNTSELVFVREIADWSM